MPPSLTWLLLTILRDATFTKLKKELEPHGGFVVSVDTPGFPVESSVHGSRHSNRSPKSNSNLPGLLGSFSVHGTNQIGNLAGRNKARSSGNLVGMSRQPLGELKEILEGRKESFSKPVKEDDDSKGEGTSKSAGAAVESSGKVCCPFRWESRGGRQKGVTSKKAPMFGHLFRGCLRQGGCYRGACCVRSALVAALLRRGL